MFKKILLIILFVFSVFCWADKYVSAQSTGIKVSPLRVEDLVEPGEIIEKTLKITNLSDEAKVFYVYLKDFKAEDESGSAKLIAPGSEEGYFLSSWLKITSEGISFEPNEEKEISFSISVPPEAGPGGYYGGIFFGTAPLGLEKGQTAISIGQQAGALVLLQVKGDVNESALIKEFSTMKNFYNIPFEINFIVRIENKGNVHIKPHGTIEIKNMLDKQVASLRVNDKGANVLPNSIRRFENSWAGNMGLGKYKAELALSFGTPADLGGEGKQTLYAVHYFWIIPWNIMGWIFSGLILIFIILILLIKNYKNKVIKKILKENRLEQPTQAKNHQSISSSRWLFFVFLILIFILLGAFIFFVFFA